MKTTTLLISLSLFVSLKVSAQDFANAKNAHSSGDAETAKIYVYRPFNLFGSLITYNLHIDELKIGKVSAGKAFEVDVSKTGKVEIWAKTEGRKTITTNLESGSSYFLKCGIGWGIFLGRPKLRLVNPYHGKLEYKLVSKQINRREYRRQVKNQAKQIAAK